MGAELRDAAEKLKALATEDERVAGALEFVQTEVRYFSVSLGESSHRPAQPAAVLKRRYGDCKDKSLLLVALLAELGVASKPALLSLSQRKGLDQMLPSPQIFDHAIVQATVAGKTYYLDPTRLGQHGRLARMGQVHEGAQALVISPETRQLSTISSEKALDLVRSEVSETATLSKFGGDGLLQSRQVWNGAAAESLRVVHRQAARERIIKSYGDAMEQRYPGAKLVGDPVIEDDRLNNVLTITTSYEIPKMAGEQGDYWFVRFSPGNFGGVLVASPSATRATPLAVPGFPYKATYRFEIAFPEQVRVMSDPRAETVRGKYFTYTVASSFRGNVAKTTITLQTLADRVAVQDLAKFAEDLKATGTVASSAVVIPKKLVRGKAIAAKAKKDFAQTLRDQLNERVAKSTNVIKSSQLTGEDLANAYCERATAYVDLEKTTEALEDVQAALKLAPNSPAILVCRAEVYFCAGEFDKSVADYSKALTVGGTGANVFKPRGISKFYAGKLDEAAEDFVKASAEGDQESQLYSDLWLAWTYLRLGKSVPEELVTRASTEPRGDWPRPARAMLTGHLTPEDLVKILAGKKGDERLMASTEGYFYLGQYYLARGDKAKAREFFEKTRQLQIIGYTEHIAARHELQALGPPEPAAAETLSSAVAPNPAAQAAPPLPGAPAAKAPVPPPVADDPAAKAAAAPKPARRGKAAKNIDPNWSTKLFQ